MSQFTQVISVAPSVVSGLEIADTVSFAFGEAVAPASSQLHKVDNGMVYSYGGVVSDISFEKIPTTMMPTATQSSYQWYCDRYAKGIANSVLGTDGAGYLKSLDGNKLVYKPACDYLRANTRPWVLFSDLPYDCFRSFDSVALYTAMAARSFAYSQYDVVWVSPAGERVVSRGWFAAIPLLPQDISPAYFLNDTSYQVTIAYHANQRIRLFWAPFWVGPVADGSLAPAVVEPSAAGFSSADSSRVVEATAGSYA